VTFLAHQAPVLPMKRRWSGLDGVALVMGSMVPDVAVATLHTTPRWVLGRPLWFDGHTVAMQLNWSLPVGLLLTWLVRRHLAPSLGPYLPDAGTFHLQDVRHVGRTRHRWWVIAGSVLIGSFTHILIDGVTHEHGWAPGVAPGLASAAPVLQVVASVVLSAVTVVELWRIGRDRDLCRWSGVEPEGPVRPPAVAPVRAACVTCALLAAVVAATQLERGRTPVVMTWFVLTLAALCLVAAAVRVVGRRWPSMDGQRSGSVVRQ
jgi:hypothetical protein